MLKNKLVEQILLERYEVTEQVSTTPPATTVSNTPADSFLDNIAKQGIDKAVQSSLALKNTQNISIYFNNYSYTEIIGLIKENDMIIHLGDHEGLGLGFFEALNNNKTLITLNTYPNSEYVVDGLNGYLINCNFQELTDNNEGITNRAIVNIDHYYKLIQYF